MYKHRMILVGIAAALLLSIGAAVTAVIWALTREDPTYDVTITTYPDQVQLQLGTSDPIDHEGTVTYTVDDDQLHLSASQDEFTNHSETIALSEEAATEVTIALDPETAEAEEQRREDSDYYQGQADFTRESLDHAEDLYESHEILQDLPEEADTFRAYAGIPEDQDHDFGVHLYVYQGNEDDGEAAFRTWAQELGYDPDALDVTIHVDDAPPVTADPPPTADELEQAEQPDVQAFTPDPEGLEADDLAIEFLTIANTHDASQEDTPTAALQRAAPLMTEDLSQTLGTVENPTVPPNWWDAIDADAVSYPWIYDISEERSNDQGRVHYTAQVCWAWIPSDEDEAPILDNPRTWDLVVAENQDGTFQVTDYNYQDAYHGDDPDQGVCSLD